MSPVEPPYSHENPVMNKANTITIAIGALLLAACAVGPNYRAPEIQPARVQNAESSAFVVQTPEALWWQQFDDTELDGLVARALAANLDLRSAYDRVKAARAVFVESKFDYAPHAPLDAAYSHFDEQQPGFGPARINAKSDSLGFDASWEIDLFGHVRRSVEAAKADLGAERANYQDAQVTVAAEVARNYFELRGAQKRLSVARENLSTQHQTLELTQLLDEAGRGSELDVQRSRARLKATEATIPPLEAAEKQAKYRLAVLIGRRPGQLDEELGPAEVATYAKVLPIGDPTQLLRRRPDVRAAEQQLAAATARVGVATADLFPRVNVTGFIGFLSGDVGKLFSTGSGNDARAWSVTPAVSWAALDLGSVHARLRASEAQSDAAAANYEKAVLTALEDTENSFVAYASNQSQLKSLAEQAQASRRAAELADIRYREGGADFLVLLDAQRTQLDAEDSVAQAQTAVNVSVVAIYKSLGGVGQPLSDAASRLARAP
jgi:outer membrane protein, multidrug efflux system